MRGFLYTVCLGFSAINATTITATLAEGTDAAKAADKAEYTVKVGDSTIPVTNVVYVDSTRVATLTVALTGYEGALTVNGTAAATGVDYKKPTIASVNVISTKQIEVTFSEKVDTTTATIPANYGLYPLSAAGATLTWFTADDGAAAGANQIKALVSKTADNKVVITLGKIDGAVNGFVLDGLTNADYLIYVKNVQDAATNVIVENSNVQFKGTTVPDSTAPKLVSANYNVGTGVLGLNFDKTVKVDPAKIAAAKISLTNGTKTETLTAADTVAFGAGAGVKLTDDTTAAAAGKVDKGMLIYLTTATKAKIDALGSSNLSVVLAAGAVVDASAENPVEAKTLAITTTLVPLITAATYYEETNVLKLTFDMPIDISKIATLAGITINAQAADTGMTLKSTANATDIELQLSVATAKTVEAANNGGVILRTNTVTKVPVVVPANLFTKVGATDKDPGKNVATTIAEAVVVQDTTAPTVTANIKGLDGSGAGTLTITGSELLDTTIVPANIKFYKSDDLKTEIGSLNVADTTITQVGTTTAYTLDLKTKSSALANNINTAVNAKKTIVMTIAAGAIKDLNLTDIAAVTTASPITVSIAESTYGTAVTTVAANPTTSTLVTITFTDGANDVQLDKAIAEDTSRYEFASVANPNVKVGVSKATYTWNATAKTGKLDIVPATALPAGDYKLTLTGLKTNAGLAIEEAAKSGIVTFDGVNQGTLNNPALITIAPDTAKPTLLTAAGAVANNDGVITLTDGGTLGSIGAGDTLTLVFSEPMKVTGATAAEFTVNQGGASATGSLGSATVSVDSNDPSKVIISLASDSTIKIGNSITVLESTKITDLAGNKVDATVTKVTTANLAVPGGLVAPVITKAVYADANNDGAVSKDDTLTLTFDQDLVDSTTDPISGLVKGDFIVTANGDLATFTPVKTGNREVTLTFLTAPNLNTTGSMKWFELDKVFIELNNGAAVPEIQNVWGQKGQGNGLTAADVKITTEDKTAPTLTDISYKASTNTMTLTFSENVSFNETASGGAPSLLAAAIYAKMTLDAGSTKGAVKNDTGVAYAKDASNNDILNKITLTLVGEAIDAATKVSITAGGFATGGNTEVVSDAAGNLAVRAQYENPITIIQ